MTNEIKTWQERLVGAEMNGETAYNAMRSEIAELRAKVESLAADAERWRFSMDFQRNAGQPIPEPMLAMWRKVRDDGRLHPTVEEYEAATDAAMAKEKA